ncbi:UNVERIFIED_CONTAM: AAA family ATPase [Campylobacter lari]
MLTIHKKAVVKDYKITFKVNYSEEQKNAFEKALLNPISIISGYPGTGKSFIINAIYQTLISNKAYKTDDIAILTPTGRAATILSEKTNCDVRTIHSFLKLSKDDNLVEAFEFEKDTKVLIIDEFSMVNLHVFHILLSVCNKVEKIVFVGDENQLPCIGPGNILEDIIKSNKFPVSRLNEIFRTDKQDIFEHFKAINNSKTPVLISDSVNFIEQNSLDFLNNIVDLYAEKVEKYNGMNDVIILLPTYKGTSGIDNINKAIQK